jgi:hypothetical protein
MRGESGPRHVGSVALHDNFSVAVLHLPIENIAGVIWWQVTLRPFPIKSIEFESDGEYHCTDNQT